ncbi:MAG: ASKHA domain-containing protein [Acidimicrobiia bacterium]
MPRVVFTPSGLEGTVEAGTTALDAARQLGVDIDSVCGGRGICGRCQITPSTGSFAKWKIEATAAALTAPGETERSYHGARPLPVDRRLGCAAHIVGDAVIDVPADSQVHRQVVRKHVDVTGLVVDPMITLAYVVVDVSLLGDARSAAELITSAIEAQHGRPDVRVPMHLLVSLHSAITNDEHAATVALRRTGSGDELVAIWPGYVDTGYGIAVDIGSTTIAGHLCDLASGDVLATAGRMNPQIRFGEDLMSRVSYVMMNPGGERDLTSAVRGALNELVSELTEEAGVDRRHVLDIVLVGNPIMHHLVLGIDPTPLGAAPFVLATSSAVECRAVDLELDLPFASTYVAPCIAGHVGADAAAAMLAEGPHRSTDLQLLVDVGTNAEIILGDHKRQFAASSPTGPALEGAQISCGQRATVGAIERVRIDRSTLEPRVKVIGCDLWSDDPGFAEASAALDISGVCGSGIVEVIAELFLAGVIDADGTINGAFAERTPRVVADGRTYGYVLYERAGAPALRITQNDVRAIQLAKGALRAGIDLLIERAEAKDVGDIRLAGAFGSHLDPLYAMVLGLVPDCVLEGVRSVGNAAGAGAVRLLLSRQQREEIEGAVREVIKIETATEPRFQELFVAAMAFPHLTAPSPHLAALVTLPERRESDTGGRRRRRQTGAGRGSGEAIASDPSPEVPLT